MEAALHKTVNRAPAVLPAAAIRPVARAVSGRVQLQSSLKVSSPRDPAEMEAEATAKRVMRMAVPENSVAPVGVGAGVFRLAKPEEKEKKLQASFQSPYLARFAEPVAAMRQRNPAFQVARKAEGQPDVSANVAADIQSSLSAGTPLPLGVRRFMEPRFGADFGNVRIHTGEKAAQLSQQFQAQAFTVGSHVFFGKDKFRPDTSEGTELIAHELTHTVQQGAAVQRSAAPAVTQHVAPHVQRLGISDALDYIADKAYYIPGFRMFTIVLGVNPINMSRVERSAANVMRAVIEFIPGGKLITDALANHGIFDKVGNWVEQQIRSLGMVGSAFKKALMDFLDSLSWRDIFRLGSVWDRAKRIFTDPIDRLINFARGLLAGIIAFIKEAILRPLAKLAEGTAGYDLLKAVLGQDPVTGDHYPRTADTLIGGFMKLIGQEEIWNNLKKANAVARAWAWFQGALAALMGFVRRIPSLFIQAFKSLELVDIVLVPRAFAKIAAVFGGFLGEFMRWAGQAMWTLLEILFAVVAPGAMPYIRKAAGTFRTILRNPIGFVGNLVRAGRLGFQQFSANIDKHLKTSLIQWLTGSMAGAGVYIPQSFEIREIIKFVLSVLGLTWQNIRQKLVRAIGETAVKVLETGFDIVVTLVTEGPAAAWEKIKEHLTNLKEMIIEAITNFVVVQVVRAAIAKLVTSLNPAGAVIQAILAIYNTIMFFIERLKQIAQVAMAFVDSIAAIAAGVIAAAANRVEQTMAGLLTLVISFLARFAGLGKVTDAVINIVNKIRAPIDKALDKVVEWIVTMAKKLGKFIAGAVRGLLNWNSVRSSFSDEDGKSHSIYVEAGAGPVKLMIASSPMAAGEFLTWYVERKGTDFQKDNKSLIGEIRSKIGEAQALTTKIEAAEKAKSDDPKLEGLQRDLLNKNVEISALLSRLVGSDASIGKAREKYKLEGLTGTYGSMPKPPGDDFTADHQPQAAILQAAAEFDYFSEEGEMAKRAAGRARAGYAINLHKIRHMAGRTYGSKGKQTKEGFLSEIKRDTKGKKAAEKRRIVVAKIKADLISDVAAMRSVAGADAKSPNWADIRDLSGGKKEEKEKLVGEVRGRILAGESQIAAQDVDSLVG